MNRFLGLAAAVLLTLVGGGAWTVAAQFARDDLPAAALALAVLAALASGWLPWTGRAARAAGAALLTLIGIGYAQLLQAVAAVAGPLQVPFGEAVAILGAAGLAELVLARGGSGALLLFGAALLLAALLGYRLGARRR